MNKQQALNICIDANKSGIPAYPEKQLDGKWKACYNVNDIKETNAESEQLVKRHFVYHQEDFWKKLAKFLGKNVKRNEY